MSLAKRSTQAERMDDDDVGIDVYSRCLADLAQVNRVTLTHGSTLRWLTRSLAHIPLDRPIAIMDVAYGQGDLLRAIHAWAARTGRTVTLQGIDLNPRSAVAARIATPPAMAIDYRTGNVFGDTPDPVPDIIVSSQFAHHLTDTDVVAFVRWMETHATLGWFVADLHRHAFSYYGFRLLARVAGWHRIVREDGTISIARSFRPAEWRSLVAQTGVPVTVFRQFPFRLCVGRWR
jgi:2-polyprenyl-3-methyl-5-hydroxy-6-metoxy-1,4-benzoquinol methylase